ncbi:MAG TPA: MBL fold metallo-hydrolase, partial [Mycobacterium sp.]|nr:MBL fold metallo-hydrolase [Mycobacterium sp.]
MTSGVDDAAPAYRSRPGAAAMLPAVPGQVAEIVPGIWCSPGLSNVYLLPTTAGRVIINAGMGFEGPVHRANLDSVDTAPVRYLIVTQGHYDHVGGLDSVRDPDTEVVAQANWQRWRDDNERLARYRAARSAFAFSDTLAAGIARIQEKFGRKLPGQSTPTADILVDDTLTLKVGERTLELIATPGGETTDSMVVWLPDERICLCGNVFGALFGHIPNLVTMRGDRYRDALTVIDTIERVRALEPDVLLTGHFGPISGAERIQAELIRLRDAVRYVHDATVAGMNAGKDVRTLMREITLPAELEVGEGYGKVAWDVRAIWENYSGWFHHRSTTELYPVDPTDISADIVELAGAEALVTRAQAHL